MTPPDVMVCPPPTLLWGLTTMNWVFPCPAILGTEVMILWGVPVSPPVLPLGAAMTMVLAPPGVVAVLVPAFAIDNMDDGIVLMMVFVVEDCNKKQTCPLCNLSLIRFIKNIITITFVLEKLPNFLNDTGP